MLRRVVVAGLFPRPVHDVVTWSVMASALLLAACDGGGPTPAGTGADILDPTITIGAGTFTLYCDGTFDGRIPVTATYPPPPPPPTKSAPGKAILKEAQASTATNIDDVHFNSLPLEFKTGGTQFFGVTGKLVASCTVGILAVTGSVTLEKGRVGTASGGPSNVGPVAMMGKGPAPDKASPPVGAFSFVDTLHCCKAGNPTLSAVAGANVKNVTVAPATIACAAGPTADDIATLTGQLNVAENKGSAQLQITAAPDSCIIKTTILPP
jgi:hypothetical protein